MDEFVEFVEGECVEVGVGVVGVGVVDGVGLGWGVGVFGVGEDDDVVNVFVGDSGFGLVVVGDGEVVVGGLGDVDVGVGESVFAGFFDGVEG